MVCVLQIWSSVLVGVTPNMSLWCYILTMARLLVCALALRSLTVWPRACCSTLLCLSPSWKMVPDDAAGEELAHQCRRCVTDPGLTPESGRSPGGGHGNLLQYFCCENPKDRGAWWATVHGVAKSQAHWHSATTQHRALSWFNVTYSVSWGTVQEDPSLSTSLCKYLLSAYFV